MNKIIYFKLEKILLILILLGCYLTGCSKQNANSKENLSAQNSVPVEVGKIQRKDFQIMRNFTGTLEGEEQANIVAKIQEKITSIKVKVGDRVKPGDIILKLDKSGASSQYYQTKANFDNAAQNLERMKALYREGAIAKQMLDGAQTAFDISKANFNAAKSMVELESPISGIVTLIDWNLGDITVPGKVIATVASIGNMKIFFNVNELDVPNFAVGQYAEIFSEQRQDLVKKGKIFQISKSADVQSRSFEIRAIFPNTNDKWFKPGMFCRVNVQLNSKKGTLVVPNKAIVIQDNRKGVYVIENNHATFRAIETGNTNGDLTEILNGLKEGETIATLGMNNLKEGSLVSVSGI
ncbi:MAG: efflux RND transporter periplasmic adaptor subunit [Ignavibacteriaceae bacterium]